MDALFYFSPWNQHMIYCNTAWSRLDLTTTSNCYQGEVEARTLVEEVKGRLGLMCLT